MQYTPPRGRLGTARRPTPPAARSTSGTCLQLGREPDAPWVTSRAPRQAQVEGFDLHADITLKSEWADGTTHLLFEPVEFLEKLAALTPRPRINLVLYHGILAPHAQARAHAVARDPAPSAGDPPPAPEDPGVDALDRASAPGDVSTAEAPPEESRRRGPERPRDWAWADLMRRVFALDVLACPRCGGRMSVIATIEAGEVMRTILGHLGLPTELPSPLPARSPPLAPDLFADTSA